MRDLAGHQKPQGLFHTRIISDVHQALVNDLGAGLGSNIGTHVRRGLTDGIDVGCRPRHACGVGQWCTGAVQQTGDVRVITGAIDCAIQLALLFHAFGQAAFGTLVEHHDD
ncbi:hypothetical protein D3C73_1197990 [compost metagenome]